MLHHYRRLRPQPQCSVLHEHVWLHKWVHEQHHGLNSSSSCHKLSPGRRQLHHKRARGLHSRQVCDRHNIHGHTGCSDAADFRQRHDLLLGGLHHSPERHQQVQPHHGLWCQLLCYCCSVSMWGHHCKWHNQDHHTLVRMHCRSLDCCSSAQHWWQHLGRPRERCVLGVDTMFCVKGGV